METVKPSKRVAPSPKVTELEPVYQLLREGSLPLRHSGSTLGESRKAGGLRGGVGQMKCKLF